jgi:hypothetical protein
MDFLNLLSHIINLLNKKIPKKIIVCQLILFHRDMN